MRIFDPCWAAGGATSWPSSTTTTTAARARKEGLGRAEGAPWRLHLIVVLEAGPKNLTCFFYILLLVAYVPALPVCIVIFFSGIVSISGNECKASQRNEWNLTFGENRGMNSSVRTVGLYLRMCV